MGFFLFQSLGATFNTTLIKIDWEQQLFWFYEMRSHILSYLKLKKTTNIGKYEPIENQKLRFWSLKTDISVKKKKYMYILFDL